MTIPEYIAKCLQKAGVKRVFGIPGGPSIPYMEALRAEGIEFILTSNEASAGIMADVTGRLTGIPGVCHATFGPGATNISTGVGEALLDRSPVIVFTSEIPGNMISRTTQMNIDHQKLFAPVTKATFRLTPGDTCRIMTEAMGLCRQEYPGPVHIGLPSDLASIEINEETAGELHPDQFTGNDITAITDLLERCRKPVLAAGLTAARLLPPGRLAEFLDMYRMPVLLTPMAKGLLPEDHPCYAGVLFHSLSDYLEDVYADADLVIGLGYDQVEFNYESWMPDVPLVHFDVKQTDLPGRVRVVPYTGPADEWFTVLRSLDRNILKFDAELVRDTKNEMWSVFNGFTSHFGPAAVLRILREELPEDVIMTADVGSHLHLAGQFWRTGDASRIIMTNGWSGMGFGLPAALAAQLQFPEATVACITGDGGFLMMAGELITARRYNLPVITVVFSDGELNLIKVKQSWKNLPPYATILYQGDLFESDRFFGIKVITADSTEKMRSAVIESLAVSEPVIINAVIDPEDYRWLIVKR